MPSIRAPPFHVMFIVRRTENNVVPTSNVQWQPVIGIIAGFLSILLAIYLIHLLFEFHASGFPRRVLGYVLPSGTRRVSHSVTESESSGSSLDLSSPASPATLPPYTARSSPAPLYTVAVPPRSLRGGPVRYSRNYRPGPRRHVDEPISRG